MKTVGLRTTAIRALILLFLSGFTLAQTSRPALRVRVVDQQKAVIERAAVVLVDVDGNKITANQADPGYYEFGSLNPGIYTLQVTSPDSGAIRT
ncbi:MAG: carboxypeptidase regulatory-like domain-containing protein [Acidobacteria bacterium]|nr:MAG: carboxypeptidase regulatory-like domain-containing protein [Acidobacteriota bacterium]